MMKRLSVSLLGIGKSQLKSTVTRDGSEVDKNRLRELQIEQKGLREVTGISDDDQRRKYFFGSGVDSWYESLREVTMDTEFIDLAKDEAEALIRGDRSAKSLKTLEQKLDSCLTSRSFKEKGAFIKLSTRSPKDSLAVLAKAEEAYHREKKAEDLDENGKWTLFAECVRRACCCRNGKDAMEILITSERVREDLKYAMFNDGKEMEPVSIVVRAFDERITPDTEFRGFVWDNQLTCVGQYFAHLFFPGLHSQRGAIIKDLEHFFVKISPHVPIPCYMVDLVWLGPGSHPILVEVNPFDGEELGAFPASTGLFNWDTDRALMTGKTESDHFELRLNENPNSYKALTKTSPTWAKLIAKE